MCSANYSQSSLKYSSNNIIHLYIQSNNLNRMAYSNTMTTIYFTPNLLLFYIEIYLKMETCSFYGRAIPDKTSKFITSANLISDKILLFSLQKTGMNYRRQQPYDGEYNSFNITNFVKTSDIIKIKFFRPDKNEIYCIINEKIDQNCYKISVFKLNINFENQTVR